MAINKHCVGDGDVVYRKQWLKVKNPAAPGSAARSGRGVGR
jgi:hypothetical protein